MQPSLGGATQQQFKLSLNANKSEFLIVGHKRQLNGFLEPVHDEEPLMRLLKG